MGLFSGHNEVYKSYGIQPLKTNPKLSEDLWKQSKLRLNKAYMDGGVEGYAKSKWYMAKQIRKKYSPKYLEKAGVATTSTMALYKFDIPAIQSKLRSDLNDNSIVVKSVSGSEILNNLTTVDDKVRAIVGNLRQVDGYMIDDLDIVCRFSYSSNSATVYSRNITGISPSKHVREIYLNAEEELSYRDIYIDTEYNKTQINTLKGYLHPKDLLAVMKDRFSGNAFWWLNSVDTIAGTIEVGTLELGLKAISGIDWFYATISNIDANTAVFVGALTGKAKGKEDEVTVEETTKDGECTESDTVTTDVVETLNEGYYTKPETSETAQVTISNNLSISTTLDITAKYTIEGDMNEIVTTTVETTYTAGTRTETDDDGNETTVDTCTKTVTTTVVTEYEPLNCGIGISVLTNSPIEYRPVKTELIVPTVTDKYHGWVALEQFRNYANNNYSIYYTKPVESTIYNSFVTYEQEIKLIPGPGLSDFDGVVISPNALSVMKGAVILDGFTLVARLGFNTTAFYELTSKVVPVNYTKTVTNSLGDSVELDSTMYMLADKSVLTTIDIEDTTPMIPLKTNGWAVYADTPLLKAKKYIIDLLKTYVQPKYELVEVEDGWTGGTYVERQIQNQPDLDLSVSFQLDIGNTSIVGSFEELDTYLWDTKNPDFENLISKYDSNYSKATLVAGINKYKDGDPDPKLGKMLRVMKSLGMDEDGVSSLMESTVSSPDTFTSTIFVGLAIFESSNDAEATIDTTKLVVDPYNARAKVMYKLADKLTGSGVVEGAATTITYHASNMNATYSYTIVKDTIANFTTTAEYTELYATNGNKRPKYAARIAKEHTSTYTTTNIGDSDTTTNLYTIVLYAYFIAADGTAIRYTYKNITGIFQSYDGVYSISTSQVGSDNGWGTTTIKGGDKLDQLVIVYPDIINKELAFREYTVLYSSNLFLYTYSRKVVHIKWYQSGFFGFVLIVAGIAIIILTAPETGGASLTLGSFLGGLVGGMAISIGMSILAPDMNPMLRMVIVAALTMGAGAIGNGVSSELLTALENASISDIAVAIVDHFAEQTLLQNIGTIAGIASTISDYETEQKMKHMDADYKTKMAVLEHKNKELNKLVEKDSVHESYVEVFRDILVSTLEDENYDPVNVPEWLVGANFSPDYLVYTSSVTAQADTAAPSAVLLSSTMREVMVPIVSADAKLPVL